MKAILKTICEWFHKKPPEEPFPTENLDQAIRELRAGNQQMTHNIAKLQPADMLRSLVISMNSGKNQ